MSDFIKNTKLWKALAGLFVIVAVVLSLQGWMEDLTAREAVAQCAGVTLVVNDSTQAQCAKLRAKDVELQSLKDAAKHLNGDLVAGTKIVIKRDTIIKTITEVVTVEKSDGTRMATLADTTADYNIRVVAEAPPTGKLKLGYTVVTPERSIEVGFVKRKDGYYAVASGHGVRTTESFFQPEKERPLALVVGGSVKGAASSTIVGASIETDVYGAVQYTRNNLTYQLRLGHEGSPYVGLAVQKKFW